MDKNFEVIEADANFEKRPVREILIEAGKVEAEKVAEEVMEWVINNVENFVDSETKAYKLDLVLDSEETMQETRKLQDLYRAIPDDESEMSDVEIQQCQDCRRELDRITKKAFEAMCEDEESRHKLFKRMAYYHEKIIPNPQNKKRALELDEMLKNLIEEREETEDPKRRDELQTEIVKAIEEGESLVNFTELEGVSEILNFEYEAFNVGVRIKEGAYDEMGSPVPEEKRQTHKEYVIPEGFTIWIQIVCKLKQRPTVMF